MPTVAVACTLCGKEIWRYPKHLARIAKPYCGHECQHLNRPKDNLVTVQCGQCGLPVTVRKDHLRKSKSGHLFCNHHCAATYHNTHKTTGTRRSKLEVWLETQLRTLYPDLDIHCNRTDAISAELDFYFPALRLAVELNGPTHYEPIYGPDKLDRVQKNDHRKFQACGEAGISLAVIDTSRIKYLKPAKAQEILRFVCGLVDQNVSRCLTEGLSTTSTDPMRGRTTVAAPLSPSPARFSATVLLERAMRWKTELDAGMTRSELAQRERVHVSIVARTLGILRLPGELKQRLLSRDPSLQNMTGKTAIRISRGHTTT